jgi:hypothetical protein
MKSLRKAALVAAGSWCGLAACEPSTGVEPWEEGRVAERDSALSQNPALRGEIAAALTFIPEGGLGGERQMPPGWAAKIAAAAGDTIEPEEVRDVEELFVRVYLEPYSNSTTVSANDLALLGSVVSVAGLGEPHPSQAGAFRPTPRVLPAAGAPLSVGVLTESLRRMGVDSLRPELVLYAAHQRDVARHNNAVVRKQPLGTTWPDIKGMTLVPTFLDSFFKTPKSVAWGEDTVQVREALDYFIRSPYPPPGAVFEPGEIGPIDEVTLAELGAHVEGVGLRRLEPFESLLQWDDVPSLPDRLWHEVLGPSRRIGQRLRQLSAILDRLDRDGDTLRFEWRTDERIHHYELPRARFTEALPHLLYTALSSEEWAHTESVLFAESDGCFEEPVGELCPVWLATLLDVSLQRSAPDGQPRVTLRDAAGRPVTLPFAHNVHKFHDASVSTLWSKTVADALAASGHDSAPPTALRPLEVPLPPLDPLAARAVAPTPCLHGLGREGGPLVADCDPCVAAVAEVDAFCSEWAWDWLCVDEAESLCGG